MFELEGFVSDCRLALKGSHTLVQEVVARAVAEPAAVLRALGEPERAGMQVLHRSNDLTILNVIWAPWMSVLPHNHQMWAVIGIYSGREDNIFWRRLPGRSDGKVEPVGVRALGVRDAESLGRDIIHSVTNPIPRLTAALHVYGGDFFGVPRSEWDPENLLEQPSDGAKMLSRFEEADREARARAGAPARSSS